MKFFIAIIRRPLDYLDSHDWLILFFLAVMVLGGFITGIQRSNDLSSGWQPRQGVIVKAGTQPIKDKQSYTRSKVSYSALEGGDRRTAMVDQPWQHREGVKLDLWLKGDQVATSDPSGLRAQIIGYPMLGLLVWVLSLFVLLALFALLEKYDNK